MARVVGGRAWTVRHVRQAKRSARTTHRGLRRGRERPTIRVAKRTLAVCWSSNSCGQEAESLTRSDFPPGEDARDCMTVFAPRRVLRRCRGRTSSASASFMRRLPDATSKSGDSRSPTASRAWVLLGKLWKRATFLRRIRRSARHWPPTRFRGGRALECAPAPGPCRPCPGNSGIDAEMLPCRIRCC